MNNQGGAKKNLEFWDRVRTPNPKFTKEFNRGGGFKGTATNTQYTIQRATEEFGMNGVGWGFEITAENYAPGSTLENGDSTIVHVIRGRVWYMENGEKRYTSEQFGQTTFVGSNKNGVFTDEEAPKKSVTDCMLKCFSLLGFNADIFLGSFDDHKYVSMLRDEFNKKDNPETGACTKEQIEEIKNDLSETGSNVPVFLKMLGIEDLNNLDAYTYKKAQVLIAQKRAQLKRGGKNDNS